MQTKRCSKCGEVKPVYYFSKDKSRSNGLRYQCKTCLGQKYPVLPPAPGGQKRCSKCGEVKPVMKFYKDRSKLSSIGAWCKECTRRHRPKDRHRRYRQSAKGKESIRRYKQSHDGKRIRKEINRRYRASKLLALIQAALTKLKESLE